MEQTPQTVEFAIVTKDNVVQQVGRSTIYQPKIEFTGKKDGIKWYEDKIKSDVPKK